ncbi:hypothetical protein [uncultured Polaribacter sp.]|uniref:hypothetical protein n=1 Tax=uncultured Polaribacter sp. TaxID=174711 RepID=UPI00262BDC10|nr:hypothetical protein [uncultured Polaribacter sp.]
MDSLKNFFEYFDFGLRILGMLVIVGLIIYFIFFRKSEKKLFINEIEKIELEKIDFETEVSLVFNKKRRTELSFRNLENQLTPFLEEIQKRNTRVEIKHL